MPNTTKFSGKFIQITGLDADWDWAVECTDLKDAVNLGGLKVSSIRFDPSAQDDIMVIKEVNASGAVLFYRKAEDVYSNDPIRYNGGRMRPFLDIGDCTFTTPANARVIIELE